MNIHVSPPMLRHALSYAAYGWAVFPCSPNDKQPLVPKSSAPGVRDGGLYLASSDTDQIARWWSTRPHAMIGLRMGTGCGAFAVDFDPGTDKKTGEVFTYDDLLDQVEALIGEPLPATLTSLTPRGGRHHLFTLPEGVTWDEIGNSRGALPDHVDIRGEGGYIVLAPSVRSGVKAVAECCEGVAYRWVDPEATIAVAPMALIDALRRTGAFARKAAVAPAIPRQRGDAASAEDEAVRRYGLAALDNAVRRVSDALPGSRNERINKEALGIGHLVGAGAIDRHVAHAALYGACAAWGISGNDKAIRPGGTLDRALDDGIREPFDTSDIRRKARERVGRRQDDTGGVRRPEPPPASPVDYGLPDDGPVQGPISDDLDDGGYDEDGCDRPSQPENRFDVQAIAECSAFDHSDTDNGARLRRHFGDDLRVMQRKGVRNQEFLAWVGTHWDLDTGMDKAFAIAQEIGGLIGLEADYLASTPQEVRAIEAAEIAKRELPDVERSIEQIEDRIRKLGRAKKDVDTAAIEEAELTGRRERLRKYNLEQQIAAGKAAKEALDKRQVARRRFGISSKNKARLDAMLACAAPHLTVTPERFNPDALKVATTTHTLVFVREEDLENPDPDGKRYVARCEARLGHDPLDLITYLIPQPYDPKAKAPKWLATLERFQPEPTNRRFLQVFAGLGLLGETVQKLLFNYGAGANAKSVVMQTIFNVLGGLSVNLEAESIMGSDTKSGSAASPDLIRLFGKRFLRISELPEGEPLKEALVKKLTGGGEELSVRGLFQGMIDFVPVFTAMMSGNAYPQVQGTNHGIWRRIAVLHWPVTIPESEQRPFNEVIDEFRPEYSGILNWLIEGALIYLTEGLILPDGVRAATQEMRDDQDPTSAFCAACIEASAGGRVSGAELYDAYTAFVAANGGQPVFQTRFGKHMVAKFKRDDGRIRYYLDIRLHDVPERPDRRRRHDPEAPSDGGPDWEPDEGK